MLMYNPPHPGDIVTRQCLEPLGLTVNEAAKEIGVLTQRTFHAAQWSNEDFHRDGHPIV